MNDRLHQLNVEKQRWASQRAAQLNERMEANPLHDGDHQHVGSPGTRIERDGDRAPFPGIDVDVSKMQRSNVMEPGGGGRGEAGTRLGHGGSPAMRDLGRGLPFSVTTTGVTQSFEVAGPIPLPFDPKNRIGYEIRVMLAGQWDRLDWFFDDDTVGDIKSYAIRVTERRLGIKQDAEDQNVDHTDHADQEKKDAEFRAGPDIEDGLGSGLHGGPETPTYRDRD